MNKQKLELTWIGKEQRPRLEPRILLEESEQSYHAKHRVTDSDLFDNRLIFGDNLLALKALEQEYTGKVKCIYIDPPYNTGNAFEYYDDGLEHSIWLNMMRNRLEILHNLLSKDGVIFVQINDDEAAYLKILMDEIFGRLNNEATFYVQVRYGGKTLAEKNNYQKLIEQVFCYRKTECYEPNKETEEYSIEKFCWNIETQSPSKVIELKGRKVEIFKEEGYRIKKDNPGKHLLKETWASGTVLKNNASGKFFNDYLAPRTSEDGLKVLYKVYGIGEDGIGYRFFTGPKRENATKGKFYSGIPLNRLEELEAGTSKREKSIENLMDYAGSFGNCRLEGGVGFRGGKKPEELIKKIISIATNPGDLILDSFAGSGTTGAVAHKMGRRWIMVELGEHCHTHIIPRLQKVIDGEDPGGITKTVNWQGGGGFRYYRVAPSLLERDAWGRWVVSKKYKPEMLSEAICKLEGFTYAPSDSVFWQQGYSTETDFIYVTTQTLSLGQLQALADEVGEGRSLLVCCGAFRSKADQFPNLTLKKIPKMVLNRCEWGHDDYSLNTENLPMQESPPLQKQNDLFTDSDGEGQS